MKSIQTDTVFIYPACALPFDDAKLIVEVGPGRGDFLFHLAETNPEASVVGIEIKKKRVDKLIVRTEKRGRRNVCIIQDDAREALPRFFGEASIDEIHIMFPDPWPKRRHEKNRAVNAAFLDICGSRLKPDGLLYFTTDHREYAEGVARIFAQIPEYESCYPGGISKSCCDAFPTFFAQKWIAMGREIFYQRYKRARPAPMDQPVSGPKP